jgi:hypothetical protein
LRSWTVARSGGVGRVVISDIETSSRGRSWVCSVCERFWGAWVVTRLMALHLPPPVEHQTGISESPAGGPGATHETLNASPLATEESSISCAVLDSSTKQVLRATNLPGDFLVGLSFNQSDYRGRLRLEDSALGDVD